MRRRGRIRRLILRRYCRNARSISFCWTIRNQHHRHAAVEFHQRAAFGDAQILGVERAVQQFHRNRLVGRHASRAEIDGGLRQPRFISRCRLQKYIVLQVEQLRLGIEQAVACIHRHAGLVFHLHLGAQLMKLDIVRIGDILCGRFRPQFIRPLICREA